MGRATDRQLIVLDMLALLISRLGYPPSLAELADALGMTVQGAHQHLAALRSRGLVTWKPRQARTFVLTEEGRRCL